MSKPIYLDYNATTPCDPLVIEEMIPFFSERFGNSDSRTHLFGWLAEDALETARKRLGNFLKVDPGELFFTSGATESINLGLMGLREKARNENSAKNHIITCKTEHKAVLAVCEHLETQGVDVTYLDVNEQGMINQDELKQQIKSETFLICLMYANNETGVIHPIQDIALIAKKHGLYFMTDATQALGKIALGDLSETGVDVACFSAHKIYGPKGVGAVYIKGGKVTESLPPLIHGGGQEKGIRSGTVNVAGIAGFIKAVELACEKLDQESKRLSQLRNHMEKQLLEIDESFGNSTDGPRLPNVTNISFRYLDGESFFRALSKDLAVSNGSACNSIGVKSSYVLQAMGVDQETAASSLRLSMGRYTTPEEIETAISIIKREVSRLREGNILWARRKSSTSKAV